LPARTRTLTVLFVARGCTSIKTRQESSAINDILGDRDINIERQVLDTRGTLGYAIYDINRPCDPELMQHLRAVPHTIAVRTAQQQYC
jgi:hypothetical protein